MNTYIYIYISRNQHEQLMRYTGIVFCSISHLLCHFPSSALAGKTYFFEFCCRACEVTLSFMDMLITLTYLLAPLIYLYEATG